MVGSAHYQLAKCLAALLRPVLADYSTRTVCYSFEVLGTIKEHEKQGSQSILLYDVVILFTNIHIDEIH